MLTPRQTNRPKRALTSTCMEVTYKRCLVFPFSLLWPTLLTCSGRARVTATSLSFLEVLGLPTLFSLNYLANWYQESSQVQWRAYHAWLGFGTLSLCLLYLFITSLLLVAFSMRRMLSIPAPQGGVRYRKPLKRNSSVVESCFSVGRIGQRVLLLPCAWKSLISVAWSFPSPCFGRLCSHVAVTLAWLLQMGVPFMYFLETFQV